MNKDIKTIALTIMTRSIKLLKITKASKDQCRIKISDKTIYFITNLKANEDPYIRITVSDSVVINTDICLQSLDKHFYKQVENFIADVYDYSKKNILEQVKEKLK